MSDSVPSYPPGLDLRFRQPDGWQWGKFLSAHGQEMRFGMLPAAGAPRGAIVALQGLSEFTEKYFETARDMAVRGYSFWMMDWRGHGHSGRFLPNLSKRHSTGFTNDITDLHQFITQHVKPASGNLPLVMLAHSMGGNMGLRYLQEHPDIFTCAAFSAPLTGILALGNLPPPVRQGLTSWLGAGMKENYVFGGGDWHPEIRGAAGRALLSSDPVRNMVQDMWCAHDPALRVGGITFGWLRAAEESCRLLRTGAPPATPCLFALAGREHLVDNGATRRLTGRMKKAHVVEFFDSQHEILMERDGIRNRFLDSFFSFIKENT